MLIIQNFLHIIYLIWWFLPICERRCLLSLFQMHVNSSSKISWVAYYFFSSCKFTYWCWKCVLLSLSSPEPHPYSTFLNLYIFQIIILILPFISNFHIFSSSQCIFSTNLEGKLSFKIQKHMEMFFSKFKFLKRVLDAPKLQNKIQWIMYIRCKTLKNYI